jgi:hypothetical protein
MAGEDSTESEPEDELPASDEVTDPNEDTISDWPTDAIPSEPTAPDWTPGEVLGYAKPPTEKLPGQRLPSKVSRSVGPIAMAFGIGAAAAIPGTIAAAKIDANSALLIGALGGLCALTAIILGTIGRLNPVGRRAATVGRRIGCAAPLLLMLLGTMIFGGSGLEVLRIAATLILVVLVGFLIILVFDAILGAD